MEKYIKEAAKAVAAAIVTCAAYLVGILGEGENLSDLSFVQWLGLIIFLGGAYGITYSVSNKNYVRLEE